MSDLLRRANWWAIIIIVLQCALIALTYKAHEAAASASIGAWHADAAATIAASCRS